MFKNIISIYVLVVLVTLSSWSLAADSTSTGTTQDGCGDTIDTLAEPYQLQYRPSLASSSGCGIGGLTNLNLFGGSLGNLMNGDFFKNALCSAVRAKIQPYVNQVNSGVNGLNNGTSLNQAGSAMSNAAYGMTSGSSPSIVIENFSSGTTSNLNQLFQ